VFEPIANVLAWFYDIWPSYAGSIILLTLAIMTILTPLTLRGTKSMMKMQRVQPEMKRLQAKYKDDRQKLNEEMMAFYKQEQINPLGGCLPLLVQAPIFIILFQVLRGLTRRESCENLDPCNFAPEYISPDSNLYEALSGTNEMISFGFDLSRSASEALSASFVTALPYLALVVIVLVTSYVQQKQISGRNPNAAANPQQQMLLRIMPAFMAVISFTLQGALVIYFAASNIYRMGQQWFITRSLYGDDEEGATETTARELLDPDDAPAAPGKAITAPKGRATPGRDGGNGARSVNRPKSKGRNKRTTAGKSSGESLPQPRPRKKKRK